MWFVVFLPVIGLVIVRVLWQDLLCYDHLVHAAAISHLCIGLVLGGHSGKSTSYGTRDLTYFLYMSDTTALSHFQLSSVAKEGVTSALFCASLDGTL